MRSSSLPSTLSYSTYSTTGWILSELLFDRSLRTTLDLIRPKFIRKSQVLNFVEFGINHRTVCDRFFDEGQQVFVWWYLGPQKWAGWQILLRSGPLFYDVKVKDQIYLRHESKLLINKSGHKDRFENQQEQLLDIQPPPRNSDSKKG